MVNFAGKPIIHYQLNILLSLGLKDIAVVGGYCIDQIDAMGMDIILNPEFNNTNMVSTLFYAMDYIDENEDLLISYGDIIYERRILENLLQSDSPISISVDRKWKILWEARMENPLIDAETLKVNAYNRVLEVGKKPMGYNDIQGQYMGLIKVRADTVKKFHIFWKNLDEDAIYDGKNFKNMYMTSFLQCLIDNGIFIEAVFNDAGWIEIDSVNDLEFYNNLFLKNELSKFIKL